MAFISVGDYLTDARVVLQDNIHPYRYSTESLVQALNLTLLDARRLRPDLFVDYLDNVPQYDWNDAASTLVPGTDADADDDDNPTWNEWVPLEQQFRKAIVHGITGHAMQRDQEDIEDERSTADLMIFENILTEVRSTKGLAAPKG
jgi:hypothetical protein